MVRVKESWTIDEDLSNWVRKRAESDGISPSELVNRMIENYKGANANIYDDLFKIELERERINDQEKLVLGQLDKVIEEGNKQQRENAQKKMQELLDKEKSEQDRRREIIRNFLGVVDVFGLRKELTECVTYQDLLMLMTKMGQLNFDQYKNEYIISYGNASIIYSTLLKDKKLEPVIEFEVEK